MALDPSLAAIFTTTASTKRLAGTGGQTSAPVTSLTGLMATTPMPVSADTIIRMQLAAPMEYREIYLAGKPDIREGDYLTEAGIDYKVKNVGQWDQSGIQAIHLIVEQQRGAG